MKLSKLALIAAVACGINASNLTNVSANEINLVSCSQSNCDCGQPVCGCETACGCAEEACCEPECGCESTCGDLSCCDGGGCDAAGCAAGSCFDALACGDCGADPWTLFGDIGHGINVGGWASIGYHTAALPAFNNRPDEVQLQQSWLYAEKALDTSNGFDIGGRFDYIYGTDGPNTQAFGIANDHWDNGWDNGPDNSGYGSAIPQLYGEVGYGDLSVKFGHFFTIIGWEVVGATGNFFYSHAYTFNFSEPFTHTGALATYNVSDDMTVWGGYSLGWDSGFEDNGDAYLGGFSLGLTDKINMIYATTMGRFNENQGTAEGAETGYMHSLVFDVTLSDKLQYIFQNDVLETDRADGQVGRSTIGINQYLLYSINDCLAIGSRFEWWHVDSNSTGLGGNAAATSADDFDVYALTFGLNYKPHSNVIMRPELRWDWIDTSAAGLAAAPAGLEDGDDSQFTFGMDTIFTF